MEENKSNIHRSASTDDEHDALSPPPSPPDYHPMSSLVDAMLTDLYQITMAYAYWRNKRHKEHSVFDLFFRKHPFQGEFTIFAGLEECLRFINCFRFTPPNVAVLQQKFPDWDQEFWEYLGSITCENIKLYAVEEGSIVIPRIPLIRVEGDLAICQLLETTLLVLVNYASLVATNAARHRLAVGPSKRLLEFGLRRAQGPDGAMSAARYAYMGGFDATSKVRDMHTWLPCSIMINAHRCVCYVCTVCSMLLHLMHVAFIHACYALLAHVCNLCSVDVSSSNHQCESGMIIVTSLLSQTQQLHVYFLFASLQHVYHFLSSECAVQYSQ